MFTKNIENVYKNEWLIMQVFLLPNLIYSDKETVKGEKIFLQKKDFFKEKGIQMNDVDD